MASAPTPINANLREELTCVICCDLFREPVMLGCMHHFCKSCISRYWRGVQGPVTCPQCRKEFPSKEFNINYLVTTIVEKVRAINSEADIKDLETQIKRSLEQHHQWREDIITIIRTDEEKMDAIKRVGEELQTRIRDEFRALHQILQEEEARVLNQQRREQEEMLEQLQRHLEASREAVKELEETIRVLLQINVADNSIKDELPQLRSCVQVDMAPNLDINAFKVKYIAPLQYTTWRKMFTTLKPGPAPLTFDMDTAHPNIFVSRDKTQAIHYDYMISYEPHPKRFLQCVNILAAQSFQSGRHYWEVGVGSKPKWDLGIASDGVDRGARIALSPENGYWTLRLRKGDEYSAGTQPWTRLQVSSQPKRIGVFLDFEERRVSFFNADDMSLLYSFSDGPRGKVFPFFSPCITENSHKHPIQLLHYPPAALSV